MREFLMAPPLGHDIAAGLSFLTSALVILACASSAFDVIQSLNVWAVGAVWTLFALLYNFLLRMIAQSIPLDGAVEVLSPFEGPLVGLFFLIFLSPKIVTSINAKSHAS